jgi:nicotinate phosphoribosyltransferase
MKQAPSQKTRNDPVLPVQSLLDIDFYKFTMGQFIQQSYPSTIVTFELINRDTDIPLARIVSETDLRAALDFARSLRFSENELDELRNVRTYGDSLFSEHYLSFLKEVSLPPYVLQKIGDQYRLSFTGKWAEVSLWETIALAIISELYYDSLRRDMSSRAVREMHRLAEERIEIKLRELAAHPDIRFADMGHRRRNSRLWHEYVVKRCAVMLPKQFIGTSDTLFALRHGLTPIGTNAHELPMILTALARTDQEKRVAQYTVLQEWQKLYGEPLRIFLPDTFGTEQYLKNAPAELALGWRGFRQDSGDPMRAVRLYSEWLRSHGVDPRNKLVIFSDGLDIHDIVRLNDECRGQIQTAFGWGTLLTNDFRECGGDERLFKPFSIVCKPTWANGHPVVKLSDNVGKETGSQSEVRKYIDIFGKQIRDDRRIIV